jgi:hypothetical protein
MSLALGAFGRSAGDAFIESPAGAARVTEAELDEGPSIATALILRSGDLPPGTVSVQCGGSPRFLSSRTHFQGSAPLLTLAAFLAALPLRLVGRVSGARTDLFAASHPSCALLVCTPGLGYTQPDSETLFSLIADRSGYVAGELCDLRTLT